MSDDLRSTFLEIDDERHQRWLSAAEADGLPVEEWLVLLADCRAEACERRLQEDDERG
jgi:hypothetical protein